MREIIVGDCDPCGPHYRIDQTVRAVRQGAVVDPDLVRREQGDAVAVRYAPPPCVGRGGPYDGVARGLAVVHVDVVDDNVGHVLECDAAVAGDVDVRASAVDGLEVVEDELVFELYGHVRREYNPVFIFETKEKLIVMCLIKCVRESLFVFLSEYDQRGSSWITAWRRVPGMGLAASRSEESVTT